MVPWEASRPSCRRTSAWTPVTAERAPTELRSRKNAGAAPRTTLATVVVSIVGAGAALAVGWSLLTSIAGRSSLPPEPEIVSAPSAGTSAALGGLVHASVVSATDAAAADSVWFLLDGRGRRVHRFDETGALLESFAGPGEGPGELCSPTAIAVHRGAVAVADRGVVRLYDFAGGSVADRRLAFDGCLAPRTIGIESVSRGLLLLVQCASPLRGVVARVFLASDDGDVRLLASRSPAGRGFVADLGFVPVMSAHPEGFVFGDANAECLDVFAVRAQPVAAEATRSVCHDWLRRLPVSGRSAKAVEDRLRDAAGAVGARVLVPRRLPPFDRVFALADGRLVYRVPTPAPDEEAVGAGLFRLALRGEGERELAPPIPAASTVFMSDNSVLAVWETLDGVRVAVFPTGVS